MSQPHFDYFSQNTLFVCVLYKTSFQESKSFLSLIQILKDSTYTYDFFIYDNSPESTDDFRIRSFKNINIYYTHDQTNSGVSKAYNEGSKLAAKLKKRWILIIDQDTIFPVKILESYYKSIIAYPEIQLFTPKLTYNKMVLSPCKYVFCRGQAILQISDGIHSFKGLSVLNSGILVSVKDFEEAGGYNEKIKLDFADFYFIDHFKKMNQYFVVIDAICHHDLSSNENDFEKVSNRFKFYCNGAKFYAHNFLSFMNLLFLCFFRATKLTVKFKRLTFYKSLFKYYIGHSIV